MKHHLPRNESDRFKGSLRHYHRSGLQQNRSWDEWIDGKSAGSKGSVKWLRISIVIVAVLALGGIIAGLVIELG